MIGWQSRLDRRKVLWRRPALSVGKTSRSKWRAKWTRPASSLIHYQETGEAYILHRYEVPYAVRSTCFHLVTFSVTGQEGDHQHLGQSSFFFPSSVCSFKGPIVFRSIEEASIENGRQREKVMYCAAHVDTNSNLRVFRGQI